MDACLKGNDFSFQTMSNFPLHEHCETCIKVSKCSVSVCPPFSCEIVSCDLACGARFHQCKLEEHIELCTKEKVPCINSENGKSFLKIFISKSSDNL